MNGLPWEADPLDWIDGEILRSGTYEPEVTQLVLDRLRDGDVFWDVGANSGVHALTVKVRLPTVQVVAIEPSPLRFARLLRNAALVGVEVIPLCVALADAPGYRPLSLVTTGNSGLSSLQPWQDVSYETTIPFWCDTGDGLAEVAAPRPNVIKLDIEGGEPAALRGCTALLADPRLRDVVFEGPGIGEGRPGSAAATLAESGFEVSQLPSSGGGVNQHAWRP